MKKKAERASVLARTAGGVNGLCTHAQSDNGSGLCSKWRD